MDFFHENYDFKSMKTLFNKFTRKHINDESLNSMIK